MPTVAEVDALVRTPKRLVRTMRWAARPGREEIGWRLFESALEDTGSGIALPGALLRAQWRRGTLPYPEKYSLALFLAEQRVYAWDVDRLGRHNNDVGQGRPYFHSGSMVRMSISGRKTAMATASRCVSMTRTSALHGPCFANGSTSSTILHSVILIQLANNCR